MRDLVIDLLNSSRDASICSQTARYTYGEALERIKKWSAALERHLPPKAKCAVICNDNINSALTILTCWYSGYVAIPLALQYGNEFLLSALGHLSPDVIITDDDWDLKKYPVFHIAKDEMSLTDLPPSPPEPDLADVCLIMYTSGTTGTPKGVMLTGEGIKANLYAIVQYFQLAGSDKILIARPLSHAAVLTGEFLVGLYGGLDIYFYSGLFFPAAIHQQIIQNKVTVFCATPTIFFHLSIFLQTRHEKGALRVIAISGEKLTDNVAKIIRERFPTTAIYHVYGLTEAAPRVSWLPPGRFDELHSSVGYPLKGVSIKIADRENLSNTCGIGKTGFVLVNTKSLMKGYYCDKCRFNAVVQNGWLNTGDLGYISSAGCLYIEGRADEMMIIGGVNVYPQEIEAVLLLNREVSKALAYQEHDENGSFVVAEIVCAPDACRDKNHILKNASRSLPKFLLPRYIHFVDDIGQTPTGKLIRNRETV